MEVLAAERSDPLFIARQTFVGDEAASRQHVQLLRVRRGPAEIAEALDVDGMLRPGRRADVKPDLHWVLEPVKSGRFQLRPVCGWYDFGMPALGHSGGAVASDATTSEGFAGLDREARLRKELAGKWDSMNDRRRKREGGGEAGEVRGEPKSSVAEVRASLLSSETKPKKDAVYPEDRAGDDSGILHQQRKRRKAILRANAKMKGAEDEAVPDTANSLLELKAQRGEAGWDFAEEEQFSDDEQENWDFDDQLMAVKEDEAPSGDEDGEETEGVDLLSGHGKEIEVLLERFTENARSAAPALEAAQEAPELGEPGGAEGSDAETSSVGARDSSSVGARATLSELELKAVEALRARGGACPEEEALKLLGESSKAALAAVAAVESLSSQRYAVLKPKFGGPSLSLAALKHAAVECLRARGGRCTAEEVMRHLGGAGMQLKIIVLKEVATVERTHEPGSRKGNVRMVVLKQSYASKPS